MSDHVTEPPVGVVAEGYQADATIDEGLPFVASQQQTFSSGLFDCFSQVMPSCLLSLFCQCFVFARVKAKAGITTWPGSNWGKKYITLSHIFDTQLETNHYTFYEAYFEQD
jgi:hypothetical protein